MPSYAVDSSKQPMVATGVVGIVQEWMEKDGKRRPSDVQARDEATGFPLWNVEVMYQQTAFGRVSSTTAMVAVCAMEEPSVEPLKPVQFEGLGVEVRVIRATGALVENWSATALVGARSGKGSGSSSSSGSGSTSGHSQAAA